MWHSFVTLYYLIYYDRVRYSAIARPQRGLWLSPPSPLWAAHFSPMTPALWNTNQFALQKHDVCTHSSAIWSYLLHCKQRLMYFFALRFGLLWSGWFALGLGLPAHEDYLSSSPTFPALPAPFRNNSPPRFPVKESHISCTKTQLASQKNPNLISKNPRFPTK